MDFSKQKIIATTIDAHTSNCQPVNSDLRPFRGKNENVPFYSFFASGSGPVLRGSQDRTWPKHKKKRLCRGPGEQVPMPIAQTPSIRLCGHLPPRVFLPRSCSSFPTGRGRQAAPRKRHGHDTMASPRGPLPPSRPGSFG